MQAIHHANVATDSGDEESVDSFLLAVKSQNQELLTETVCTLRNRCGDELHSVDFYESYLVKNLNWLLDDFKDSQDRKFSMLIQNLQDKYLNMEYEPGTTAESSEEEVPVNSEAGEDEGLDYSQSRSSSDPFSHMTQEERDQHRRGEDYLFFGPEEPEGDSPNLDDLVDGGASIEVEGPGAESAINFANQMIVNQTIAAEVGAHNGRAIAELHAGEGERSEGAHGDDGDDRSLRAGEDGAGPVHGGEVPDDLHSDNMNVDYREVMARRSLEVDEMLNEAMHPLLRRGAHQPDVEPINTAATVRGDDAAAGDDSLRRVRPRIAGAETVDVEAEMANVPELGAFVFHSLGLFAREAQNHE